MTRQEAIAILKHEKNHDIFVCTEWRKKIHEALEMAISSLETDEAYQLEYERTTEEKYCDRNICARNDVNGIGCEDCEVTKSQKPITINDLGVDCISRQEVIDLMMQKWGENFSGDDAMQESIDAIREMPSVTPQEPKLIAKSDGTIEQIKNCEDCLFKKEWRKIGKLLSAILEKHTEREPILDKIRAEIKNCRDEWIKNQDPEWHSYNRCLQIIDKYKAEIEPVNGEMLVCPACGLDVHSDFKTCPRCGAKINKEQEQ